MRSGGWQTGWILKAAVIRRAYALEALKAVPGHADAKITEIYAERDSELPMRVMREIG
jgi:hypothetical protein